MCERGSAIKNALMRFSLDLINFSGVDSLHMIYSAELTRWVNFDSFVLATYGSQAYHKASIEAERVNV